MKEKSAKMIYMSGAVLVLTGAVLPLLELRIYNFPVAPCVFSLGIIGVLLGRYLQPLQGSDFRIKRLRIQQIFSSLFLIFSAYLMFVGDRRWVIPLFMAAVIDLVIAFRVPSKSE